MDASAVLNTSETVGMGDGDSTGACWRCKTRWSWARGPRKPVEHIEWTQRHARHSQRHGHTSADPMESISTCQNTTQTQSLPVGRDEAKSRSCVGMLNMRVDMHGVAYHANTAGTHRNTSVHTQKTQNHQTHLLGVQRGTQAKRTDLRPMQACREHIHTSIMLGTIRIDLQKTSIMLDLPARGAEPHKCDLERLESQSDVSNMRARMQSIASNSNTPENVSVTSETPDLPARGAILRTGEPKRLESRSDVSDT